MKKQIITIAGGGSTYTPGIVQAILNNEKRLPLSEIRLYDIDEERNMDMYLIVKFMLKRKGFSNIRIRATDDPKLAFTGCDFVFSQIRVGGLEMREKDEKIPLKRVDSEDLLMGCAQSKVYWKLSIIYKTMPPKHGF